MSQAPPTFDNLPPSTRCIMAYSSVNFDLDKLYNLLPIYDIEAPLTKKQKHVDKKKVKAPYGTIVSVSTKRKIRGLDMKNKKKKNEHTSIDYFLNQVTVVLSIGKFMLNIMIFKNSFKIAGCKIEEDAIIATRILWEDYISKTDAWSLGRDGKGQWKEPRFAFEVVMFNVGFNLGFDIDRDALNVLMNSKKYEDRVSLSQYDSTIHTSVNIKLFSSKPEELWYDCLCYGKNGVYLTSLPNIPYKKPKNKKMYTTFIVFSSSETILTGRYVRNMKEAYQFFVSEAFKNKKKIEERVIKPKGSFVSL